jgi:hypothetical protein
MKTKTTAEMLKLTFPNITFPPNKYIDLIEPTEHISDKLYYSNLRNEDELYNILNKNRELFKHTPRYCELDFIAETDNANIFIELKSRNIKINAYKSTIFPLNKIEYYRNLRQLNREVNNILLLIFSFIDENGNNRYYYIQYNKVLFSSYKKMKLPNGIYYNILIKDLKPLDDLKIIK